jgi:hypothetical protein
VRAKVRPARPRSSCCTDFRILSAAVWHSPESLGVVVGTVHMMCVIIFQVYYYAVEAGKNDVWLVKREVVPTPGPQEC